MNRTLTAMAGLILCGGLAACGTTKDVQELSQKTVQYRCGPNGEQPLSVQYTFQGTDPVTAKVIYQNQAFDLTRTTASNTDMAANTFRGSGYTWTTRKFTEKNVASVDGDMLTQDASRSSAGAGAVSNILVKDCKVAG